MRLSLIVSSVVFAASITGSLESARQQSAPAGPPPAGARLDTMSWQRAEQLLKPDTIVVLPLGAGASQHGPHLPLGTDQRLVEHLTHRIVQELNVVVAPTIPYHHLPGFDEYPGSTSLSLNTARDTVADVARSLARYGPRRFYVVNASPAALPALAAASQVLLREGLLLRSTDVRARLEPAMRTVRQQPIGGHADEVETSMMLFIDPSVVDMARATRELGNESLPLVLTRRDAGRGTYSASGVWGDATLATREKGSALVEALMRGIRIDIDDLRRTSPPPAGASAAAPAAAPPPATRRSGPRGDECQPGDDRAIRAIGPAFSTAWLALDALRLASLWHAQGDMVHPDGFIEGSAQSILENRAVLFARPEYGNSRHGLLIGQIRCISSDIAVADARWDLRGVTSAAGTTIPSVEGLCTLVVRRGERGWLIEAYRYSFKNPQQSSPALLSRPGFLNNIK